MADKLQKLLAHAGLGSRREIETWIDAGRITVNGRRAKLGDRAESTDRILVDGKLATVSASSSDRIRAIMYHKPEGEICTRSDPKGRPTIFEKLPPLMNARWVSVGRLDLNTSGLILLTDSGELANKLMHPSTGLEREYLVRVRGRASPSTIELLTSKGVMIDGRKATFDSVQAEGMAEEGSNHWYRVVIREGRYREVRRLWEAAGHTVSRLKRIRYGTIKLHRALKLGQHEKIAPMQLEKLVKSVGLYEQFSRQLYSAGKTSGSGRADSKRTSTAGKPARNAAANKTANRGKTPARRGVTTKKTATQRKNVKPARR